MFLIDEGTIAKENNGKWQLLIDVTEINIPSRVYDIVKRRLDRLMGEQKEILECAAVIGEKFSTNVLEKTIEMRRINLLKNLSEIEKAHRLIHYLKETYKFDHTKIREVLYNGIGEELRMEYHRIVAETMADLYKDNLDEIIGELAHHYYIAEDKLAANYMMKAGDIAKDRYANKEAIRMYNNALPIVREQSQVMAIHGNLGELYGLTGQYEESIDNYEILLELTVKIDTYRHLTETHRLMGNYEKSLAESDKGLELLKGKECLETGGLMGAKGWTYVRTGRFDDALEVLDKYLKIANESGNNREIARANQSLGALYWYKSDYDKALYSFKKSLEIREKENDIKGMAAAFTGLGNVYGQRGEIDKGLEYYEKGLDIAKKVGDKTAIAVLMGNIGIIHYTRGDLDSAQQYYEEALETNERMGSKSSIGWSLNGLGTVHNLKNNLEKAQAYFERSHTIMAELGDKLGLVYSLCNLADVHIHLGEVKKAHDEAKESLKIITEIGAKNEEGMNHRILAMTFREMKEWNSAIKEFDKAKEILKEVGDNEELGRSYYESGLMWNSQGETEKAKIEFDTALKLFEDAGIIFWANMARKAMEQ